MNIGDREWRRLVFSGGLEVFGYYIVWIYNMGYFRVGVVCFFVFFWSLGSLVGIF